MMETANIKDLLTLLCIHPEKGWVRKRSVITYALVAAALNDLVLTGKLKIRDGRIEIEFYELNDPMLHELVQKLNGLNGKKISWLMSGISMSFGKYYRLQIQHLVSSGLIDTRPLEWMGISWGTRYRVNKSDRLKPVLLQLDRVLIYGREPNLKLRLLIELLAMLGVLPHFFPDGELKSRAKQRVKTISSAEYSEHHDALAAIRKELRNALRRSKASSGKGY